MNLLELLFSPFAYPFMFRALLAALIVSAVCAVVGSYIVLRGMAFFGDALAHTLLPGVALGYLLSGANREALFWWALGTSILVSLGIGTLIRSAHLREDTAIGIVFAGMFALGIALISTVRSYAVDLSHFLFGDVLGVSEAMLWRMVIFGGIVLLLVFLLYKEFLVISFDPVLAATLRLPTRHLENLFLILLAITIVVALQTVGVALMVAMLITPATTAYFLTHRLPAMMGLATIFAIFSSLIGLYLSYYLGIASGAAIVLVSTVLFAIVFLLRRNKR